MKALRGQNFPQWLGSKQPAHARKLFIRISLIWLKILNLIHISISLPGIQNRSSSFGRIHKVSGKLFVEKVCRRWNVIHQRRGEESSSYATRLTLHAPASIAALIFSKTCSVGKRILKCFQRKASVNNTLASSEEVEKNHLKSAHTLHFNAAEDATSRFFL